MPLRYDQLLLISSATATVTMLLLLLKKNRKTRKHWAKSWLQKRLQGNNTVLSMLNNELLSEDPKAYSNFLRMNSDAFENIYGLLETHIQKQDTNMREAIPAKTRLQVTLRYLATGESFRSLMYATRIHESTISHIVPEVCQAIYDTMNEKYLQTPNTSEQWAKIATQFESLWNFPHCVGALDGRHIEFRPPRSSGSYYYNYKGSHSIVLLALVDANYQFTYVNIGVNGRISDGGVFRESLLSKAIHNNKLNFPEASALSGRQMKLPYMIVADDAFPLTDRIMKPYPQRGLTNYQRIFNYRLSRARRIVENAFGILVNRFRVLLNPIALSADKTELITLACVILHNYLASKNHSNYIDHNDELQCNLLRIGQQGGNMSKGYARQVRDELCTYFNGAIGSVPWQQDAIERHNM